MAVLSAFNCTVDAVRAYTGSVTWGPLVSLSRSVVISLLRRVEVGQIVVTDVNGIMTLCGAPQPKDGTPRTELKVLREAFWVRLFLFADMVRVQYLAVSSIEPPVAKRNALRGSRRASCSGKLCVPTLWPFSR